MTLRPRSPAASLGVLTRQLPQVVTTNERKGAWRLSVNKIAWKAVQKALEDLAIIFVKWAIMAVSTYVRPELMFAGVVAVLAAPQLYEYSEKAYNALGLPLVALGALVFPSAGAVASGIVAGNELSSQYDARQQSLLARMKESLRPTEQTAQP